ncbi:MAG: group II intron reverse transcriptase/maturase [Gammaproteobacteria bacterium]|nr:group II intron reverse transcriptase/maturase [Gammaproteobacteria bacterium]
MRRALQRVRSNKGAPGVDGMTVDQLPSYLRRHWDQLKQDLLNGTFKPMPVRRKEIPKPGKRAGVRLLGIPTALDRLIQQAVAQVLQQIWEPEFSDSSFGFRPGRCQHDAIYRAKGYIEDGYRHVVDCDLSKFFDRVNHDRLLSRLATRVHDKRLLKLIRGFLTAGVMIGGLNEPVDEGTPQGGPLSPLLSNIVLDEFDKELEQRGLHFVRYADDFIIFIRSKRAAKRVMESVSRFIARRLKLKVNQEKSKITHPWWMCFLGFSFTSKRGDTRIRIHSKSIKRLKDRIRELTDRNCGRSIHQIVFDLNQYLRGWWNYYRHTRCTSQFRSINGWIMRRLRAILWKQWKNPRTRVRELKKRGIFHRQAVTTGNARKGHWRMSKVKWVIIALPNAYFRRILGLYLPGINLLPDQPNRLGT